MMENHVKLLSEEYSHLYHYTNATGLKGIIENQTLWATHYKYLSDATEIIYFEERLLNILCPIVKESLEERRENDPLARRIIDSSGELETLAESEARAIVATLYNVTFGGPEPLIEPFIASFCTTSDKRVEENGL